jgi:hypothetical protein
MIPPVIHAARISAGDGRAAAMTPVVRKIPEPMTLPTTKRVAERTPRALMRPSSASVLAEGVTGATGPEL